MDKKIMPRKLAGFWELSPEKQIVFEDIIGKIENVFKRHCFLPLDTPVMELSEILLAKSGGEMDKEIYRFVKGSTDACLRYDFTVPLARYVAMNENVVNFPFKRYQIGKVYRGERPQKGRLREFYQCDADIVGDEKLSLVNDAECVKLYEDIFRALKLEGQVEISSRKLLFGLVQDLGAEKLFDEIAIILDKLDKIGKSEVLNQLAEIGLPKPAQQKLVDFVAMNGSREILEKICRFSQNATFVEGCEELKEVCAYLDAMGCKNYSLNFGIIRGHNYYTGIVFEAYLKGRRELGAIGGGGRYDELASFFTSKHLPGVGMSVGLSRLFTVLEEEGLIGTNEISPVKLAIIPLGQTVENCLEACCQFQNNGIDCEVMAEERSFKAKMKDAGKRQIPFVAIIGEDEVKNGKIMLKNMQIGEQESLDLPSAIEKVKLC